MPLFEHALTLHRAHPDRPVPDGPYPDDAVHRRGQRRNRDRRRQGLDVAAALDRILMSPPGDLSSLLEAFHGMDVPRIEVSPHITAAALRADEDTVRRVGRYLARRSPDRCTVKVGLALLTTVRDDREIPLLQTLALLVDAFSALACEALSRRPGGDGALLWLGPRTGQWGRVYVVEALCRRMSGPARHWLLRHSCEDVLAGYYAGKVALAADLHTAITTQSDAALIDHTTRLLSTMATCTGEGGGDLDGYLPAKTVLQAHTAHLARLGPSRDRVLDLVVLADALAGSPAFGAVRDRDLRQATLPGYLSLLRQPAWQQTLTELGPGSTPYETDVISNLATRLGVLAQPA